MYVCLSSHVLILGVNNSKFFYKKNTENSNKRAYTKEKVVDLFVSGHGIQGQLTHSLSQPSVFLFFFCFVLFTFFLGSTACNARRDGRGILNLGEPQNRSQPASHTQTLPAISEFARALRISRAVEKENGRSIHTIGVGYCCTFFLRERER